MTLRPKRPWQPVSFEKYDVYALQAVAAGVATEGQQKHALDFIIMQLCGTYDLPYRPDEHGGQRDTDFAAGAMFVGQQIVKLLKINASTLQGPPSAPPSRPQGQTE